MIEQYMLLYNMRYLQSTNHSMQPALTPSLSPRFLNATKQDLFRIETITFSPPFQATLLSSVPNSRH